jgi:hypothetical protein
MLAVARDLREGRTGGRREQHRVIDSTSSKVSYVASRGAWMGWCH